MEDDLDKIAKGLTDGYDVCVQCNMCLDALINNLNYEKKLAFTIDDNNKYIVGKYGPVIQCAETVDNVDTIIYKPVKNNIDMTKLETGAYKLEDIVQDKTDETGILIGKYKEQDVFIKKGRYGLYVAWDQTTKTLKELGKRDLDTITLEEIIPFLECSSSVIREITKEMSIRNGAKGHYIFYKNAKMKKPKFCDIKKFNLETDEDYKICNIDILKSWIKQTYNIE
jgi:hypothetical protein